ncbi:hypothetical protein BBK36DRAFT_1113015 [Trichoderma citrinoviride]|uniref:C3H1-type domain-containing protein n=1 Tax=Trichoderma citrinoviride TaxID=58853 RepID=A0A2T4BGU7_9HYPO|nr:hypothetical protein BBK36DRAFT_1113015 [Trichoderma citrinoviride]PTB68532.1 hypothetical protein BBK36DRAFT_1113015 [Trichoderma citrinoviride]
MQSWSGSGQNGATDGHNSWQSGFAYPNQGNQFDPSQAWPQPAAEQASYSHLNQPDPSASGFFEAPHQGNAFLAGGLHSAAPSQTPFHAGHGALSLNQQFSQAGPDVMDPAFSNIHPDLYGHQSKVNLGGDGIGHMGQVQGHPHAASQAFTQHEFQFAPQNEQLYDATVPYNGQPQQVSQSARQGSHTPVQQFDDLHGSFPQGHRFGQPGQPAPVQHQQQQPYRQGQAFSPAVGGQGGQYQLNSSIAYQQPNPQYNTQQQGYAPQKANNAYSTPPQGTPAQQTQALQQPSVPSSNHQPMPTSAAQYAAAQQQQINAGIAPAAGPPTTAQPATEATKKRKRMTKSVPEPAVQEQPTYPMDLPVETTARRDDDSESLPVPVPTAEEAQLIAQFAKRSKAAQIKYPTIRGLPHLVFDGTIKLPAPKSYDKLSPCIALPPRNDRPAVPELGYLPCEIQGKFSTQYRPSADKGGLDERREEASQLLDEYDRAMQALGKRRPKYTEYPHAFKEQLKSDEASKNKAEKRAKKEQEDDRAKPIRSPVRPADPTEAAAWDAIGIVHIEASVPRTNALIAGRVQQAGEFFIKLRNEMNKAKSDVDNAVKNKVPDAELAELKKEAEQKKEAFYRAIDVTLEHADDAVLDNLGGHQKLVLSLINAMIASIKAGDFSGKLPKALLELFTHFRMTKKIAETPNFETVRKRFEDKGDDDVKEMAREIAANMRKVTKADSDTSSTGYTGTSAASRAKAGIKPSADVPSAKRGRDDDADSRTVKKIAVEPGNSSLSKKLAQPKIHPPATSKIIAPKAPPSSLLPGKARPVPKPAVKSEVDSPSGSGDDRSKVEAKKPATKVEPGKVVATKVEAKPHASKASSTQSASALSGIASLLDSINAPKAPEALVSVTRETRESSTPEDPEEKAKRLRKEARRKLRVSWKADEELVQVRVFHKDDEEDEGREGNMIRDAADDRSEGMVLKQRANVDEDEDDDDIPYQPWLGPVATDFTVLPDDVRSKSFVTRGGTVTFATDEQQRIAEREQRELMAIYTDVNDIPATPKSPLPEAATPSHEAKTAYLPREHPQFEEIQQRWRDEQQYGPDEALRSAMKRLDAKHSPSSKLDSILGRLQGGASASTSSSQQVPLMQSRQAHLQLPLLLGPSVEALVLALLQSDKVKAWRDANPVPTGDTVRPYNYTDPTVRLNANAIEEVTRMLIGKPFPATSPPEWLSFDQERIREWWFGYNKEAAARQKKEEEARARAEAEANALKIAAATAAAAASNNNLGQDWAAQYAQHQSYAPYMALLQQMTGGQHQAIPQLAAAAAPAASQIPDGQLQSILAAINQPQQAAAAMQAANLTSYLNPNDPSYQQLLMLTQMAQGQQPPPPPPPPPSYDHRGERGERGDRGDRGERDWDRNENPRGDHGKEGRKKKGTLPPHKPANKALIGTKPCTFWQQGKCARGDKCTFRHG